MKILNDNKSAGRKRLFPKKKKSFFASLTVPKCGVCSTIRQGSLFSISKWRYELERQRGKLLARSMKAFPALVVLVALAVVWKTGVVYSVLAGAGVGKIEKVTYVGYERLTEKELSSQSRVAPSQSLFAIDEDEVVNNLRQLPWVRDAKVNKKLFNELEIKIIENKPLAIAYNANDEGEIKYLNYKGEMFASPSELDDLDYPVVTGLEMLSEETLRVKAIKDTMDFLNKAAKNNPNLPLHEISEVHIDPKGELTIYLVDYSFPIYVGNRDINKAYVYLVRVLKDMYGQGSRGKPLSEIAYIQLDYINDQVLVVENGAS